MRGLFVLFILLNSFVVKASTTINFNYYDNHKVCKLLNALVFIVSDTQIDNNTIATKRIFEIKNFSITCDQKRTIGSLFYSYEEAHAIFPENMTTIQLTDFQAINVLYSEGLHDLTFDTYEKVGNEPRFKILCEHQKDDTTIATVCTATAIKN